MDFFLQYPIPAFGLLLLSLCSVIAERVVKRKRAPAQKATKILAILFSGVAVLSSAALGTVLLVAGGGIEGILPVVLLLLLAAIL